MWDYELKHHLVKELTRIADTLEKLYKLAVKDQKTQYQLIIIWKGLNNMSTNSVTLNLTAPFGSNQAVPVETENGSPFTFTPSNIAWSVQTPSIASFVQNSDGSATFTPLAAGSTGVAVQDTSTGATAQGTLTVTGGGGTGAFAMAINWQAPAATGATGTTANAALRKAGA